jgi:DNA anti-recombination protein RmuC
MMGAEDVRPFLKVVHNLDINDPPAAWETHKQKLREQFQKSQEAESTHASTGSGKKGGILGSLFGSSSASKAPQNKNIIDMLETFAKEEREAFAKEQEQNRAQILEMQRQHEETVRKQMEENKSKNLKLADYLMGAGQPPVPEQPKAA